MSRAIRIWTAIGLALLPAVLTVDSFAASSKKKTPAKESTEPAAKKATPEPAAATPKPQGKAATPPTPEPAAKKTASAKSKSSKKKDVKTKATPEPAKADPAAPAEAKPNESPKPATEGEAKPTDSTPPGPATAEPSQPQEQATTEGSSNGEAATSGAQPEMAAAPSPQPEAATPPPPPQPPKSAAPKQQRPSGPQQQGEWTLFRLDGRDYVTMQNVAEFYGLTVQQSGKAFLCSNGKRRLRGEVNGRDFFINDLKFILSYPILEHAGQMCLSRMDLTKLVEPVMRPSKIKGAEVVRTVVLDAGHGGHDNGAWSPYGHEKQFTLDVAYRAKKLLEAQGYRVVMTRSSDTFIPLYDRARIANRQENALFISIHFNSGGAGTGLETYTLAPRGVPSMMADGPSVSDLVQCPGNINDAENMALATATHASLVVRSRLYDRGIKRARFVVIRETTIPAVLIEGGFLSNSYDAKVIANPQYRQQMATSILTAVNNYRRAVGTMNSVVAQQPDAEPRVRLNTAEGSPEAVGESNQAN